MKNYLKKLAFLFTISLVFITSCSKEEPKIVLAVDQTGGIIYKSQVVTIALTGIAVTNPSYDATMDGVAIKLSKAANDKLTFLVPASISLGLKDLVIPELNNTLIHYDIKETILTQSVTETLTPLFDNVATCNQNLDGSPEALEAEATLNSFTAYFAQASEAEKTELAVIYKANKLLFDSILLGTYAGRLAGPNEFCFGAAVIGCGASIALLYSPTGVGQLAGLVLLAPSLYAAIKCGKLIYDELVMCENITVNGILGDNNRLASTSILLQNDVASTLTLNLLKRKLIASDSNKTQTVWVSFFSSFNLMNFYITVANAVIPVVNNLPFVNIAPFTLVQLPSTSANVAVEANATAFSGMQFSVNHPNLQLVSATLQGNGQMNLKVKFVGTPTTLPVSSFLNYSYSDEYTSFSGKIPISVGGVNSVSLIGNWLIVGYGAGSYDLLTGLYSSYINSETFTNTCTGTFNVYTGNHSTTLNFSNNVVFTANGFSMNYSKQTSGQFCDTAYGEFQCTYMNNYTYSASLPSTPTIQLNNSKLVSYNYTNQVSEICSPGYDNSGQQICTTAGDPYCEGYNLNETNSGNSSIWIDIKDDENTIYIRDSPYQFKLIRQ